jgi:HlyD family secretion protein
MIARFTAALLLLAACRDAPVVQTAVVARRDLVVPILADGTLEPGAGGEVRAAAPAVVSAVYVTEGQRVAAGAALLRLDNVDVAQRFLASREDAAQLDAEQRAAAGDARSAELERDHAKATSDADARLLASGAITAQQKAAGDLALQQADEKLNAARARMADLAKRKQLAQQSSTFAGARLRQLELRAPAAGVVYNLVRAGESVNAGQVVATVGDPLQRRVRARVDAPDLPRVAAGQKLVVTFDGKPGQRWLGSVTLVPPGLRESAGREVGEVIGRLTTLAEELPANASVNVEIIAGEKSDALVIPRGALLRDGNSRYVFRDDHGVARRVVVGVGLIGPNDVEITSGLREGDRVILPGSAPLRNGQRVQSS